MLRCYCYTCSSNIRLIRLFILLVALPFYHILLVCMLLLMIVRMLLLIIARMHLLIIARIILVLMKTVIAIRSCYSS